MSQQQTPASPNSRSFFQFMQKAQEDIQEEFKIRLYVSLYFRALHSDQVLNYDEKAWLVERIEDLYSIDIFAPLQRKYTLEEFSAKASEVLRDPLDLDKILSTFIAEGKESLCYELVCFAASAGDRYLNQKELDFLNQIADSLQLSPENKKDLERGFFT
ncbi:MAG: hypothetical protein AAF518_28395 [Spirochaetota bacterium]